MERIDLKGVAARIESMKTSHVLARVRLAGAELAYAAGLGVARLLRPYWVASSMMAATGSKYMPFDRLPEPVTVHTEEQRK